MQLELHKIDEVKDQPELPLYRRGNGAEHHIRVYGLVNPEPDTDLMVQALLEFAKQKLREKHDSDAEAT